MVYQAHSQYCVRGRSDDIVVRSDERKFGRYIGQLTSDFIGPQIFNFERSLNLSPGPKSTLVSPCIISLGGPACGGCITAF
jgi:hypothetical protein